MAFLGAAPEPLPDFYTTPEAAPFSDGVVIVDTNLVPIALDRGAEAIFCGLAEQSNGNGERGLPQLILNLLQARSTRNGDTSPMFVASGGHHFSCRAFKVRPLNGAPPMLTLYLKREVSPVDAAHQLAVEYRLTDREEEALIGLSMGLSAKELAEQMRISPNTVKAFLRMAMVKIGTSSRARLFAKLLDRQTG